jgi:hypothetical protein
MESVDKTLFTLNHDTDFLLVQIYVNDIIFGGSFHTLVFRFQEMMESKFQMSMIGELTFFLGIQMKRGTFVHQAKYTKDLMKKFNMAELKPVSTLMSSAASLGPDEDGEAVDQREYRSMISSLLYLTATRPDIQFAMGLCARFQSSPRSSHRTTVQRVFRYLKHTPEFGIWYSASSSLDLVGFLMLILWVVGLTERALLGLAIFLDLLLFAGLLRNSLQLHSPPPRPSM